MAPSGVQLPALPSSFMGPLLRCHQTAAGKVPGACSALQPCTSWDSSDGAVGWSQCWGFSRSTFGVPLSSTPQMLPRGSSGEGATQPGRLPGQRGVGCQRNGAVGWQLTATGERGQQPAAFYSIPGCTPLAPTRALAPWQLHSHHIPALSLGDFVPSQACEIQSPSSPACPDHQPVPPQYCISHW